MVFDPLYLEPGDLRHSITIQAPSSTDDEYGQPVQTWTNVLTTRASIRAASQREQLQSDQLASQVTYIITIRYPGSSITLSPGYRVVFSGQNYTIQAIDNVLMRNRIFKLQCVAVDEVA